MRRQKTRDEISDQATRIVRKLRRRAKRKFAEQCARSAKRLCGKARRLARLAQAVR